MRNLGQITTSIAKIEDAYYESISELEDFNAPAECIIDIDNKFLNETRRYLKDNNLTARKVYKQLRKRVSWKWIFSGDFGFLLEIVDEEEKAIIDLWKQRNSERIFCEQCHEEILTLSHNYGTDEIFICKYCYDEANNNF